MKPVQVTLDEALLRRLDRNPDVREKGRSAVVRRAISEYLDRREAAAVRDAYRHGYGEHPASEEELGPWPEAQAWPED